MNEPLSALSDAGVSIWLDDLSRERISSGNLAELVKERHVVGVTTNPTIFASALAKGEKYDDQMNDLAGDGADVDKAIFEITTTDVRQACDILRPVHDATGGLDGRVSLEVEPGLARDCDATVAMAKKLWAKVDRPNLLIKIPATLAGVPAIAATTAQGISVNVTLIFSLERYDKVMDAFLAGLEQAQANGHDLSGIGSVASFFVSRVDSEIDERLDALGTDEAAALKGQAGVANARLAYHAWTEVFSTPRWQVLADAGAHPQRPLWASTGVKNPDYSATLYVDQLVAPGVVNTMPGKTLELAAQQMKLEGGVAADTVTGTQDEADAVLDALERLGISYAEVTEQLEREGLEKFDASWAELTTTVSDEMGRFTTGSAPKAER